MKIGIDISQLVYSGTGVANYLNNLVESLLQLDQKNEYILFASSLRQDLSFLKKTFEKFPNVTVRLAKLPPSALDMLWNKLHILPIETFIGTVDLFISSDWTEPPLRHGKKVTILYDLIVYTHPEETAQSIIEVQQRKLSWVKKETDVIFCISEATKKDAQEILGLPEDKLHVLYPGLTL